MNQIAITQNEERQLERLAAQRELYSSAKKYYLIESVGSVAVPVMLTAVSMFLTNIAVYSALYGICFYILDSLIIEPFINEKRIKAAKIQEMFDCDVLEIERSPFKSVSDVTVEDVLIYYDAHRKIESNIERIRDWYSAEVGGLDISAARLICQRMNFGWDSKLRGSFSFSIKILTVLLSIMIIAGITLGHLPGEQLPLVLSGILPLYRFCLKLHQDNRHSTEKLAKLNAYFDGWWAKVVKNEADQNELGEAARRIQDEIYDNRIKNPLIPDVFYNLFRSRDEILMKKSAAALMADVKELKNGASDELEK